jgi:hypothetical protein
VRTLADETEKSGCRQAAWDCRDDAGQRGGAGVYLCRLRTDELTASQKIVLLR